MESYNFKGFERCQWYLLDHLEIVVLSIWNCNPPNLAICVRREEGHEVKLTYITVHHCLNADWRGYSSPQISRVYVLQGWSARAR